MRARMRGWAHGWRRGPGCSLSAPAHPSFLPSASRRFHSAASPLLRSAALPRAPPPPHPPPSPPAPPPSTAALHLRLRALQLVFHGWWPSMAPSSEAVQRWLRPFRWDEADASSGAYAAELARTFAPDLRLYAEERRRRDREADQALEQPADAEKTHPARMPPSSPPQLLALEADAEGCLALALLLTHIAPRLPLSPQEAANCDLLASGLCLQAVADGFDVELDVVERALLYSALLHAESGELLREAERLLLAAMRAGPPQYRPLLQQLLRRVALYQRAMSRFGRLPHLNARKGRADTEEEAEWKRNKRWNSALAPRRAAAARDQGEAQQPLRAARTAPPPPEPPLSPSSSLRGALRWPRADG